MSSALSLASPLELALARATAAVEALGDEELEELAAGRAELVLRPTAAAAPARRKLSSVRPEPARRALHTDIAEVVVVLNALTTPEEVTAYLDGLDARFTVPVLKEIARAIGPTVATTGRTRAQVKRDIVAGTAGFRTRSAAMSGGAWG